VQNKHELLDLSTDTCLAFRAAGCQLHSKITLKVRYGTVALRAGRQMGAGGKPAKVTQEIQVHCKGTAFSCEDARRLNLGVTQCRT